MKKASDFLREGAKTFEARNKTYGDNYLRVGAALAALFPDGINVNSKSDQDRFHIFMLVIVKLSRYTTNWDKGGHADSIHDASVYCAMLESIDAAIQSKKKVRNGKRNRHLSR